MRRWKYFFRGRLFPCVLLFALMLAGTFALALLLPRLLAPVALAERVFSFVTALAVVAERDLPERKIAKLFLLFFPWVGAALCLLFRSGRNVPSAAAKTGPSGEGAFPRIEALSEATHGIGGHHVRDVTYFSVGREMYERLLTDLRCAQRRIYLEYYIIARGVFWGDVLELLKARAEAGVDVRVIYDDFGCALTLPEHYYRELAGFGIRAACFRRLRPGRGFSHRDHRKLAVIDDVAYVGGINLADEYIGEKLRFGHWKDTAVRIAGTDAFTELLLRTWYALNPSDGLPKGENFQPRGEIPLIPLSDGEANGARIFPEVLLTLCAHAKRKLWLCTPYLSLPYDMVAALSAAARAGVDVRILIPHIPDKRSVFLLTRAYGRVLEEAGVSVREYTPGFLHAKSAVVDGELSLVSSCNLDFRSLYIQAECGAVIADMPLAQSLERDFLETWRQSAPLPKASAVRRGLERALMLFAPLA